MQREGPPAPWQGFASTTGGVEKGATLWCVAHLPQNRDVWALTGGDGSLSLFRYRYPDQRCACVQSVACFLGLPTGVKPLCAEPVTLLLTEQRSAYAQHRIVPLGVMVEVIALCCSQCYIRGYNSQSSSALPALQMSNAATMHAQVSGCPFDTSCCDACLHAVR